MKKPELVAPAGTFENLLTAVECGADAVYLGPRAFSLRAGSENFDVPSIGKAADVLHAAGRKLYLTLNSIILEKDLNDAKEFIKTLKPDEVDGVIISDPALIAPLKDAGLTVHISTQVSVMNAGSAAFWGKQGIKRIVLARELSLPEIGSIVKNNSEMEFEVFAHGAMCMSVSGRCLLSDYLVGRAGNRGECAQPCRWDFSLTGKNDKMEIVEENGKTMLFNSRDLNTISIIGNILDTGVSAIKIEGRNKGVHYIAVAVKTYREAIDLWSEKRDKYQVKQEWIDDLNGLSNRGYTTGFYKELAYGQGRQYYTEKFPGVRVLGIVREVIAGGWAVVDIKNDFMADANVSIFSPEKGESSKAAQIIEMNSIDGKKEERVAANRVVLMKFSVRVSAGNLVREAKS
ncbi:MAG: U32 family peptidase [Fibrobacteres bacterium]|nr:U32 family peptidase [Fibrobacterota bacterium]